MKSKYKNKTALGQSFGEIMHHIGKQTTEQVKKSLRDYSRKKKHKGQDWDDQDANHPLFI